MKPTLTPSDFTDDAQRIGCDVAAVMAVCEVESRGRGFDATDFPKTLFEAQWFHRLTKGVYDASHPHISSPTWDRSLYGRTPTEEKARLDEACSLDRTAALQATSWGLFQIMGFNHAVCGKSSVQDFVNAMCDSEDSQLSLFTAYVIHSGLADELRDHRWADFARLYNGKDFRSNQYDTKLAAAHAKFVGQGY